MHLLSWNVQWFLGIDGRVDVARVIRHAQQVCDFDVLCLQEVAVHFPGLEGDADFDQVGTLAELLPGYEIIFGPALNQSTGRPGPREQFGNLVASRLPVQSAENHLLPLVPLPGIAQARRACLAVQLQTPNGPLMVMTSHLAYHAAAQRESQAAAMLAIYREYAQQAATPALDGQGIFRPIARSASAIVCGDFNCEAASAAYQALLEPAGAFCDAHKLAHPHTAKVPTFGCFDTRYTPMPIACDHILVTPDLAPHVVDLQVDVQTRLSDHQPVFMKWLPQ